MAIFWDAPVSPDDVTALAQRTPLPDVLTLSAEFPTEYEDDNTVDWATVTQTNRTARYRSFDGRIHVSRRDAGNESRVRLLPLSSSLTMGEYERLQLEFARTGGTNRAALARSIYNDTVNLTREVQYRTEQAWGDVLTDAKLTISENGFFGEADFGMPGNHLKTAGTAWTNVNALILDDMVTWSDDYATGPAQNGVRPKRIKTSLRVQRLMQRNVQLIGAVHGNTSGKSRVTREEINDLFASEGLPTLDPEPYDTVVDVDGVSTRVLPDDRLLMLPQNLGDLGALKMGVSATALEMLRSGRYETFEQVRGIVGVVDKADGPPYRQQVLVDAVGMPVLKNSKLLMVADVA